MAPASSESFTDLESQVLGVLEKNGTGVSQTLLQQALPSMAATELVPIINKFINLGRIELLKKGKQLIYVLKTGNNVRKGLPTGVEEKLMLDAIERTGGNGATAKDIKFACNLPQPQITKFLKDMEARKLIKCVPVAGSKSKKVYILFGLEPNVSVTGGTFYSGQDFEEEFVDILTKQCYQFLLQAKGVADKLSDPISQKRASSKSSKEICDYINNLKISKVDLSIPDIESILNSLIYDAKIEKFVILTTVSKKTENFYVVSKPLISNAALMRMPCGVCHVFNDCGVGRNVSPSTCIYMKEWLDF